MRICVVLPSFCVGGSTSVAVNLAKEYSKRNKVCFIVFNNLNVEMYETIFKNNNIEFKCLNRKNKYDIFFLIRLKKAISTFNPDCIHSHLSSSFYVSLVCKKPIIHTIHADPELDIPPFMRRFLKTRIKRKQIKMISCSEKYVQSASSLYGTKVISIVNGINIINDPIAFQERNKKYDFLFVGRFSKEKNILFLLDSFNSAHELDKNLSLCLCGIGGLYEDIRSYVENKGLSNSVYIVVDPVDVNSFYNQSKIFCLFSLREGAPIVILEAMSHGMPILFSDIPGVYNYLKDGVNGEMVDLSSAKRSGMIMYSLISNSNKMNVYSENNYRDIKKFDIQNTSSRYEKEMKSFYE